MINQESLDAVLSSRFKGDLIKPLYETFCFSQIPDSISSLLSGSEPSKGLPASCFGEAPSKYDTVILLFLDAFGWKFFTRFQDHPFCQRFFSNGVVSKLTAQFPSTTSAQVTTISTGLEVGQTGIYEWYHYEPKVQKMIAPLLFSFAGDKVPESLLSAGVDPRELFPFETLYQRLHIEGVRSHVFQQVSLCSSPYSQAMCREAHIHSYYTFSQALKSLLELVQDKRFEKTYAFLYFPSIDSTGHRKGVDSVEIDREIKEALDLLEHTFMQQLSSQKGQVALMVTADHGMTHVNPRQTVYINQELKELESWVKKDIEGRALAPAGSCRDLFLHIEPKHLMQAKEQLAKKLSGVAEVYLTSDLIQEGLFGQHVTRRFLDRIADLVILPGQDQSVWWYEKHRFEQNFYGAHGGLSKDEQEIPFLFLPL